MADAQRKVPVIGLVGGIGSGKSFLARSLQDRHRVVIVDGDSTGHQVLKEESVKQQIRRTFGQGVFDRDGEVDRREMSALVFGSDPRARSARGALEAIVHPRIAEKLKHEIAAAQTRPEIEFVVLDAALLLEAGWRTLCDFVVYVDVPDELRRERVRAGRGWSREQLEAREQSQFPLKQKRMEADDVVDNSEEVEVALSQLEAVLTRLAAKRLS